MGVGVGHECAGLVTLVWHDWIEIVFRADPDEGSAAVEWPNVLVLALVAFGAAVAGSYELRRGWFDPTSELSPGRLHAVSSTNARGREN
jgi:hypothetical protein